MVRRGACSTSVATSRWRFGHEPRAQRHRSNHPRRRRPQGHVNHMNSFADLPDDADRLPSGQRRCTAKAKATGTRCKSPAISGAPTCRKHGSGAPQVRRKARLRLLELVDPAIATLAREMATAEKSTDRRQAAIAILDRAGFGASITFEVEDAREMLVDRLLQLADVYEKEA